METKLDTLPMLRMKRGTRYYVEEFVFSTPAANRTVWMYVSQDNPEPRKRAWEKAREHAKAHGWTVKARIWSTDDWKCYHERRNKELNRQFYQKHHCRATVSRQDVVTPFG